jgi:hypothetical protein
MKPSPVCPPDWHRQVAANLSRRQKLILTEAPPERLP